MAWDRLIKHEGVFTLEETNIYLWMRETKVFGTLLWLASAWIGTREGSDSEARARAGSQAAWVPIPDLACSAPGYLPGTGTALGAPQPRKRMDSCRGMHACCSRTELGS